MVMPEYIYDSRELDREFVTDLDVVMTSSGFGEFLYKWHYWIDDETKKFRSNDWEWVKPLLDDLRPESGVTIIKDHEPILALAIPYRILQVTITAHEHGVPWGSAYNSLRSKKEIDF